MLLRRLAQTPEPDRRIQAGIRLLQIERCYVGELSRRLNLTRQNLSRQFRMRVGVGPKCYSRIYRLRRLVERAKASVSPVWSDLAAELGYCDQAYMINECRALTGLTPAEPA